VIDLKMHGENMKLTSDWDF